MKFSGIANQDMYGIRLAKLTFRSFHGSERVKCHITNAFNVFYVEYVVSVQIIEVKGKHEIVSLVGTLADGGHLHASLSDKDGHVVGGHVMGNMEVFTTAEVVIGNCDMLSFTREMDDATGFDELVVTEK